MKIRKTLFVDSNELTEEQKQLIWNLNGQNHFDCIIDIESVKNCLEITKELNDGNSDDEVKFMEELLIHGKFCDFVIVT